MTAFAFGQQGAHVAAEDEDFGEAAERAERGGEAELVAHLGGGAAGGIGRQRAKPVVVLHGVECAAEHGVLEEVGAVVGGDGAGEALRDEEVAGAPRNLLAGADEAGGDLRTALRVEPAEGLGLLAMVHIAEEMHIDGAGEVEDALERGADEGDLVERDHARPFFHRCRFRAAGGSCAGGGPRATESDAGGLPGIRNRMVGTMAMRRILPVLAVGGFVLAACMRPVPRVHAADQGEPKSPQQLVNEMLAHEEQPHKDCYEYLNQERSDRTGGHLWTERVVETSKGKLRLLLAEDGKPLGSERVQAERAKLDAIAADPAAFEKAEATSKNDEVHARQMLDSLPKGFLLEHVSLAGNVWRVDYRPKPDYSPSTMEEHVLHGMSGWFTIDARDMRLVHIEGKLAQDVTMGLGLINIRAGSSFASDRADEDGRWRTVRVQTDIRGRALLFKTISRNSDVTRSEFHYLDQTTTVPQAVALLEK